MIKYKKIDSESEITEEKKEKINSIKDLLQRQVCHEFANERLYISMSLWCENNGYVETAAFFMAHSLEERRHGMDFLNYMSKRKMKPHVPCDEDIEREFEDMKTLLRAAVKIEITTTNMIKEIHQEALKTSDLALTIAEDYLQEQVEEEQLFLSLANLYNLCGDSKIDFEMEVGQLKSSGKYKIGTL